MPTVEDVTSGPSQELQASGNRCRLVALFPTPLSPTAISPPSHFFIGEIQDRSSGAFAPIRSRTIDGHTAIARATGNRREETLIEGPLGPRADFIVSKRVRPSSLPFTPERRLTLGESPNSRSRERLRAVRQAESASARPSPAVQYELSSAQHVARTLTQEMNNARENVETGLQSVSSGVRDRNSIYCIGSSMQHANGRRLVMLKANKTKEIGTLNEGGWKPLEPLRFRLSANEQKWLFTTLKPTCTPGLLWNNIR